MTLEIHKFKRSAQPSRYCCFHQILSASFVFFYCHNGYL
nr:MAG TPA: hypothetical protein [Caudoviricetes sp.]DAM30060.1 MAG TPA: hypothetical protein [Caudoviricetes sp.]